MKIDFKLKDGLITWKKVFFDEIFVLFYMSLK